MAIDRGGKKIGRIRQVWIDDHSGRPAWATVEIRRGGRREAIVPLSGTKAARGRQRLACGRAEVMSAPEVDRGGHFGLDDEWRLFTHYDLPGAPEPTRRPRWGRMAGTTRRLATGSSARPIALGSGAGTASSDSRDGPDRISPGRTTGRRAFLADLRRSLGLD